MKNFAYFFVNSAILSVFVALCVNSDENIAQSTDKSEDSNMVLPIPDFLSVTTVSTIDNCTNATSGICNNVDNNTAGNENQSIELIPLSHHSNVTTVSNSTTNASSEDIDNSTQYLLDRAAASAKPETGDPLLINSNTSVASVINKIYSNYFWMPDDSDRLGKKTGIKKSNSTVNRTNANAFSHTFSNGTKIYKYQNKSAGQPAIVPGRALIILTGEIPKSIDFTTSNVSEIDENDFISNPEIDALMTDYVTKQIDSIVTENITNFDNETKDGTRNENNTNANINGTKDGIRYVCNDSASDTKLNVWKVVNSLADILLSEVLKRNNETGTTPSKRVQDGTESDSNSDESHENKGVDETDASDGEEAGTVSADESTDDDTKDTSFEEPDSLSISEERNKNKNADSSSSDQDTIESEEGKTDSESEEGKKDTDNDSNTEESNDNEDGDSSSANVSVGEKAGTVSDDKAKHSSEIEGADSWTPVSKFSSEETTPQKTKKQETDCEKNKHGETTPQKTNSREPNYQKNKYGEPTPETADSRETNYQKNRYAEPTPDTTDSRETTNYHMNKYGETAPQQTNSRKPNYQKNQYGEPTPESTNSRETNYQKNKYGENKRQKNRYGQPTPETSTSQETNYQKNKYGESNHRKNRYGEPSSDTRNSQESNNQKNRYVQPTPDTTDSRETNYQKNKYKTTNYQRIKNKDANFGKTTSEETTTDKSDDEYYIKFGLPKISNPRYTKYAHNPFASGLGFLKQKQIAEKPTTAQNFHDSTPPPRDSPPKSDNSVRQAHSSATVAPDVEPGYYIF